MVGKINYFRTCYKNKLFFFNLVTKVFSKKYSLQKIYFCKLNRAEHPSVQKNFAATFFTVYRVKVKQ